MISVGQALLLISCYLLASACSEAPAGDAEDGGAVGQDAISTVVDGGARDGQSQDVDAGLKVCPATPPRASDQAPIWVNEECSYMDWTLSPDGFYIVSQFGTTQDPTTMGRNTSCGALQTHYAAQCCLYDVDTEICLDEDASGVRKTRKWSAPRGDDPTDCQVQDIPETGPPEIMMRTRTSDYWYLRRSIDWSYWTVVNDVQEHYFREDGSLKPAAETAGFAHPDYFYTAGAQRFGCDAYLRVSNLENGHCIVVYADDGGPGSRYESESYASRHILDASPAMNTFLDVSGIGWQSGSMVYVEWALPGDRPGDQCIPCQSTPARKGTELHRSPYDLTHGFRNMRACREDALYMTEGVSEGTPILWAD